jgi:hypothetical protein
MFENTFCCVTPVPVKAIVKSVPSSVIETSVPATRPFVVKVGPVPSLTIDSLETDPSLAKVTVGKAAIASQKYCTINGKASTTLVPAGTTVSTPHVISVGTSGALPAQKYAVI